jgi:hypothetical protein
MKLFKVTICDHESRLPGTQEIAICDTLVLSRMPELAFCFPLPKERMQIFLADCTGKKSGAMIDTSKTETGEKRGD